MTDDQSATLEASLRLGGGFTPDERAMVLDRFAALDSRLRSYRSDAVELLVTVKERGEPSQRTTLEAWIVGQSRIVATSSEVGLEQALNEVRDDLVRQLTDAKNRTEPRNNRQLRRPS